MSSIRVLERVHPILIGCVYTAVMTVFAVTFLFWISFQAVSSELIALVVPKILEARYAGATATAPVSSPFGYSFNMSGTLYEAGSMGESSSPYFWVNSGGKLLIEDGVGKTAQGTLAVYDPWRLMYKSMNSVDSQSGYSPQNTFRMVTRATWSNVEETLHFNIKKTNLADSPNRDGYSGIFLMGRYADSNNLYYAGIRHDGQAVIKKKINGTYYTLAYKQVFGEQDDYYKWTNPNLIPQTRWMALRARFVNQADGSVKIQLLLDRNNNGVWESIITTYDKGTGGPALKNVGALGIRTDFMDVEFDDFRAEKI